MRSTNCLIICSFNVKYISIFYWKEFIIDPNMKSDIDAETKEKLNLVEKEMAWESEKNLLSLRKLEAR